MGDRKAKGYQNTTEINALDATSCSRGSGCIFLPIMILGGTGKARRDAAPCPLRFHYHHRLQAGGAKKTAKVVMNITACVKGRGEQRRVEDRSEKTLHPAREGKEGGQINRREKMLLSSEGQAFVLGLLHVIASTVLGFSCLVSSPTCFFVFPVPQRVEAGGGQRMMSTWRCEPSLAGCELDDGLGCIISETTRGRLKRTGRLDGRPSFAT